MNCASRRGYWDTMWLPWPIGSHWCWPVRIGMGLLAINIIIQIGVLLYALYFIL